ncbi:hypothetical protein CEUSTIGMA_g8648.t1 [Chlamydomonas eustigma]|uniref:Uncharacterized protein n=1 Tax=Chlamydomonas eustigma TaxID=1157962 RepID=A0A250XDT7_9CHLO|nr:hypothetical protein CEUSTIGMA_g8648.t1 [Chlamydomonas eustigma]|eukprot:GAX81216.1 hypothetical protein CEUSTIGMA_g8648.t1 [Chlamydomonas eustigma]
MLPTSHQSSPRQLTNNENTMASPRTRSLPRLHYCAFKGDLVGVLECITEGESVHTTVTMKNQQNQTVCGITPLFLAAQKGNTKVCKILVQNGANPNQPSYIQGTTELCTPAEVAQLNLHVLLARYLKKMVKQRRKEDELLSLDEADDARRRNDDRGNDAVEPARAFMQEMDDLANWDPKSGAAVAMDGQRVKSLMKKQNIDLYNWRPQMDLERSFSAISIGRSETGLPVSKSRVVDPIEMDQAEVEDHGRMLNKFLKDLDLQSWDPEEEPRLQSKTSRLRSDGGMRASDNGRDGSARGPHSSASHTPKHGTSRTASPSRGWEDGTAGGLDGRRIGEGRASGRQHSSSVGQPGLGVDIMPEAEELRGECSGVVYTSQSPTGDRASAGPSGEGLSTSEPPPSTWVRMGSIWRRLSKSGSELRRGGAAVGLPGQQQGRGYGVSVSAPSSYERQRMSGAGGALEGRSLEEGEELEVSQSKPALLEEEDVIS